jgi:hypothetical protein
MPAVPEIFLTARRSPLLLGVIMAAAGCGSSAAPRSGTEPGTSASTAGPAAPRPPRRLQVTTASARLPEGLSGEAIVPDRGGVLSIGGLDPSLVSTSGLLRITAGGVRAVGALATPLHDAAAAKLGGRVLVLGGGAATTIADVESIGAHGGARVIGQLPTTRSDLSTALVGRRVYVLGGYDGTAVVSSILETIDGRTFREVARLPVPIRYGAVVADGDMIYSFGGERSDGTDTDAIQSFDIATGRARVIGHARRPFSHGSALALDGRIFVLGGRIAGNATNQVLEFDASSRALKRAGRLPRAVTNAAAATSAGTGYLVGGLGADGAALDSVITLELRAAK